MLTSFSLRAAARHLPQLPGPVQILIRLADVVATWERRARERKTLSEMPDQLLKDIGITRLDAHREAEKPFWRP